MLDISSAPLFQAPTAETRALDADPVGNTGEPGSRAGEYDSAVIFHIFFPTYYSLLVGREHHLLQPTNRGRGVDEEASKRRPRVESLARRQCRLPDCRPDRRSALRLIADVGKIVEDPSHKAKPFFFGGAQESEGA